MGILQKLLAMFTKRKDPHSTQDVAPHIFVSYSSKDRPQAGALARALGKKGWVVWWDKEIPAGKRFDQAISQALDHTKCIVVLWSKNSVMSDWVMEEALEGKDRGILVPVSIDNVRIPFGFRRLQAADLKRWRGGASSGGYQKLLRAVEELAGSPSQVPTEPVRQPIRTTRRRRLTGGLDGKTIVFTGALAEPRRAHAQKVEIVGARFVNSVSSATDYLVVGQKPGAKKLREAKRHRTQTLAEKEWLRLLNDAYKRILKDKTVVFAGKFSRNRAELTKLAERLEATVGKSVTSKTQYLIVGTNAGAKTLEAAREHHVRIINEELWKEIAQSL